MQFRNRYLSLYVRPALQAYEHLCSAWDGQRFLEEVLVLSEPLGFNLYSTPALTPAALTIASPQSLWPPEILPCIPHAHGCETAPMSTAGYDPGHAHSGSASYGGRGGGWDHLEIIHD